MLRREDTPFSASLCSLWTEVTPVIASGTNLHSNNIIYNASELQPNIITVLNTIPGIKDKYRYRKPFESYLKSLLRVHNILYCTNRELGSW